MTIPAGLVGTLFKPSAVAAAVPLLPTDQYYGNVSLLLHGDGTDGTNTYYIDSSPSPSAMAIDSGVKISTEQSKFGGSSIKFMLGGGARISAPSDAKFAYGTGDFTWEMWIYPTMLAANWSSGTRYLMQHTGGAGLLYQNNTLKYYNGASVVAQGGTMSVNQWSHIAVSRSAGVSKLFINGQVVGSGSDTRNMTTASVFVGGDTSGNYAFQGYIDDTRITKGVARYTANFTVPSAAFPDAAPNQGDSYFANVSSLFHFDGANNSTTFTDQKPSHTIAVASGGGISNSNSYISTTQSKFGGASYYHGTGSALISSAADTAWDITGSDFTVETWIYLTSYNSVQYNNIHIVSYGGNTGWNFALNGSGGVSSIGFITFNAGAYKDTVSSADITGLVTLNNWHHVAVSYVFSTKTYKFFLNGVQKGTAVSAGAVGAANSQLSIGRYIQNTGYPSNYWNGYLDELRITKGTSRYSTNFTVPGAAFPNA